MIRKIKRIADENINYGKGAGHMLSREQCLQIIIPIIPFTNKR